MQCSESVFAALKLSEMPAPSDYGQIINGRRIVQHNTVGMGADAVRYRVLWNEFSNGAGSKQRSSSFSLSRKHTNETLYLLAEFLRSQGVDFDRLANKHGNGFKDARLTGSELAYLSTDRFHSILRDCDLFVKPSPEDG